MSGLSGKSKSARIVAEPAPLRDPMIGKSSIALLPFVSEPIHS
jgi:hypothetical protein